MECGAMECDERVEGWNEEMEIANEQKERNDGVKRWKMEWRNGIREWNERAYQAAQY